MSDDYKNLIQSFRAIYHYKYTNSKCTSSDMNADTGKRTISKGLNDRLFELLAGYKLFPDLEFALVVQILNCLDESKEENAEALSLLKNK